MDNSTAAIEAPCELLADRALLEPEQPIASDGIAGYEWNSSVILVHNFEKREIGRWLVYDACLTLRGASLG